MKWFYLAIGGTVGTTARYVLEGVMHRFFGSQFPYGTLSVNLTGCFLIGLLAALSEEKFALSPNARILLMIGFCGAFTTFSTFILETSNLIRDGESFRAFVNVLISVAIGFLVFHLGFKAGELI